MTTDEAGKVIVARIIIDSVIERQGLLRPGDLILEANNSRVKTPEQLQNLKVYTHLLTSYTWLKIVKLKYKWVLTSSFNIFFRRIYTTLERDIY